ncbi:PTS sugar transporter subunit IIA [Thermovenabulum gondwanense]|uniref:Transcriptional regulator ManR n=1 Tax=Thermovenabulum gondwanense TaxID=520767 RepID=A0A161PW48_9FIRM|nr:PTS sugar transporter subunit IIA [Thermovenabulum gondwanense]KYO65273.1 Transcriptional regulator ManR [Thermovenabulum gondwanense]
MDGKITLEKNLIFIGLDVKDKLEAISQMATKLEDYGYVNNEYKNAVIEREKVFPTGLPTKGVGVAIPHTDIKYVNKSAIAIGVLKNPVLFNVMGNPEENVEVKLIFMLALKEPKLQVNTLRDLVEIFQDENLLAEIVNSDSEEKIIGIISKSFVKSESA